ncbi:MAG: endolytic transglycosylase MltG [Bryobacteraceae bacterium]
MKRFLAALILLAIAASGFAAWSLLRPYAAFEGEAFVDIPKGSSTRGIAARLEQEHVVEHEWQFLLARMLHPRTKLQAGEYSFTKADTPLGVFSRIAKGDVFHYDLVIPEGQNLFDVAAAVGKLGWISESDFMRAAKDPALIRDLAPEAQSLEGYLFPDTYRLTGHATAKDICRIMTQRFRAAWKRLPKASMPLSDAVTLASLIEKEAAASEDRPMISSVFHNRLKAGMKLDCDPTTVYAALLEGRYRGTIYQSDLASRNPYNTYQHVGLPPGPIANPGLASLRAALQPAESDYVFFVARPDGSGRHIFSKDLAAHNQAAELYRSAIKKSNQKTAPARVPGK